jgi:hypothetical protein
VLSIPKKKWQLIEPSDLERAKPAIRSGDIVLPGDSPSARKRPRQDGAAKRS